MVTSKMILNATWIPTLLIALLFSTMSFANPLYWLCGPDEDGCSEDGDYEYCACVPYNETNANKPYCLNFDELSCAPLAQNPNCNQHFIFKNQTSCLATIFHSIPDNPCTLTTASFCMEHHPALCDESGTPSSCKH